MDRRRFATKDEHFLDFPVAAETASEHTPAIASSRKQGERGRAEQSRKNRIRRDDHRRGGAARSPTHHWRPGISPMSPLWSDIGLARAARAKAEEDSSVDRGKAKPLRAGRPAAVSRPVRRVLHPHLSSFAL